MIQIVCELPITTVEGSVHPNLAIIIDLPIKGIFNTSFSFARKQCYYTHC
jgi:hypothetical protein